MNFLRSNSFKLLISAIAIIVVAGFMEANDLSVLRWFSRAGDHEWYRDHSPEFYLFAAPDGSGSGASANDPMSLELALASTVPGTHIYLTEGEYSGTYEVPMGGTYDDPVVVRACPDQRATINGTIRSNVPNVWIRDLEVTRTLAAGESGGGAGIDIGYKNRDNDQITDNVYLINNVIHHVQDGMGVAMWNYGSGQVAYGNITYYNGEGGDFENQPTHNYYTQNDYALHGYKYFIKNLMLDSAEVNQSKSMNMHAWAQAHGVVSGFWFENNIVRNGEFWAGSKSGPAHHITIKDNYFYRAQPNINGSVPHQMEMTGNWIISSGVSLMNLWGYEPGSSKPGPNVFKNNVISAAYDEQNGKWRNIMRVYTDITPNVTLDDGGEAPLDPQDEFDFNNYYRPGGFFGYLFANDIPASESSINSFEEWRAKTSENSYGMQAQFDQNSTYTNAENPSRNKVFILSNDYSDHLAYVAVYNFEGLSETTVDLTKDTDFEMNGHVSVHDPRDFYGPELSRSSDPASVTLPLGSGDIMQVFVLKTPHADSPCDLSAGPFPTPESTPAFTVIDDCSSPFSQCVPSDPASLEEEGESEGSIEPQPITLPDPNPEPEPIATPIVQPLPGVPKKRDPNPGETQERKEQDGGTKQKRTKQDSI